LHILVRENSLHGKAGFNFNIIFLYIHIYIYIYVYLFPSSKYFLILVFLQHFERGLCCKYLLHINQPPPPNSPHIPTPTAYVFRDFIYRMSVKFPYRLSVNGFSELNVVLMQYCFKTLKNKPICVI
jgi:hypothetical protein